MRPDREETAAMHEDTVTTTNETVTGTQIRALRAEAKLAGDDVMADICDVALAAEEAPTTT